MPDLDQIKQREQGHGASAQAAVREGAVGESRRATDRLEQQGDAWLNNR
jgi:hypothetical protein